MGLGVKIEESNWKNLKIKTTTKFIKQKLVGKLRLGFIAKMHY